jgi:hypothetical protein
MADEKRMQVTSVKFCGHNPIIYWWPIWLFGYVLGIASLFYDQRALFERVCNGEASWHTLVNLSYLALILFVFYFTNVHTEKMAALLAIAIIIIVFLAAFLLGVGKYISYIPGFRVFMNSNFYFTFATGVLGIWAFVVFWVDQVEAWYLYPGSVVHSVRFQKDKTYTMEGLTISVGRDDIPCHFVLGLGMLGDVEMEVGQDKERQHVVIRNVSNVWRKNRQAHEFIRA